MKFQFKPREQNIVLSSIRFMACHSVGGILSFLKADTLTIFYGDSPPSTDSRRVVVSYNRECVHEVMVNCLVKLVQEKVWLGELTFST